MLTAAVVLQHLLELGISHVIGIPDNSTATLHRELEGCSIRNITVTREGEAFALAAGIWIGGQRPCVLIQNTGLLESGDSLRGTLVRMKIPAVCLISCRGYPRLSGDIKVKLTGPPDPHDLSKSEFDSVALITEPTLRAWGIPYWSLREDRHLVRMKEARDWAEAHQHPVALLIETGIVTGVAG